ncbi:MAG: YbjQ family protein [Planctomycetota bacterium]
MIELALQIGIPAFFILLGLVVGTAVERAHFRGLAERERELAHMLVTDVRSFPGGADPSAGAAMVVGQAVIATDYLKSFLASLKKLLGGELGSYLSLLDRARREAVLRMLEEARQGGYDAVCNLRLDTADIGGSGVASKGAVMVALIATGTAYRRRAAESGQG